MGILKTFREIFNPTPNKYPFEVDFEFFDIRYDEIYKTIDQLDSLSAVLKLIMRHRVHFNYSLKNSLTPEELETIINQATTLRNQLHTFRNKNLKLKTNEDDQRK